MLAAVAIELRKLPMLGFMLFTWAMKWPRWPHNAQCRVMLECGADGRINLHTRGSSPCSCSQQPDGDGRVAELASHVLKAVVKAEVMLARKL